MAIFDIFSGKSGRQQAMANQAQLDAIKKEATGALETGFGTAKDYYGQAKELYQPQADLFGRGQTLSADALGLNGPEGTARARAAYSYSPGQQFALEQGLGALERTASSRGQLGGGGSIEDLLKYATGYANQNYGDWQTRLAQYNPLGLAVTGAQAGTLGQLGNLGYNLGQSKANVFQNIGQQGIQNANMGYQAGQNALANDWNAIFGGAKLAASMFGSGSGGGLFGGGPSLGQYASAYMSDPYNSGWQGMSGYGGRSGY